MHPGGGRFPRGIESRERGTSPQVGFDPAHCVVGRGAHRYEVARDVQTIALAGGKDPREALADIVARSEERRVGKSVDLGGRRIIKKKKEKRKRKRVYE